MQPFMVSRWSRRDAEDKKVSNINFLSQTLVQSLSRMWHVGGLLQLWGDPVGDGGEEEATEGPAPPLTCSRAVPAGH